MRFLLKIRKSFCVSVVFFFPDDNITQVDTQQYNNHNKMEKLIYCSFLASETHFDSNLKNVIFFLFLFSLFVQKASANCWNKLCCDAFIAQISFLKSSLSKYPFFFTKWEKCFGNPTNQRCAAYQLVCCLSEETKYRHKENIIAFIPLMLLKINSNQ